MRFTILALIAWLPVVAAAQEVSIAQVAARPAGLRDAFTCYWIDSQKEWQRVPWVQGRMAAIFAVHPRHAWATGEDGWTVDRARYAKVGGTGHSGNDAAALAPFDRFKFARDVAFGALLFRSDKDQVQHLRRDDFILRYDTDTPYLDFRINDTGLGDNGGRLRTCVADAAKI